MKTIYKYELEIKDEQSIELPIEHKILTVQTQNGKIVLWAVVDTFYEENTKRNFKIFGTGNRADELELFLGGDMEYISTVQLNGFVWHIFIDL